VLYHHVGGHQIEHAIAEGQPPTQAYDPRVKQTMLPDGLVDINSNQRGAQRNHLSLFGFGQGPVGNNMAATPDLKPIHTLGHVRAEKGRIVVLGMSQIEIQRLCQNVFALTPGHHTRARFSSQV